MSVKPNERQVGGSHYGHEERTFQHWDLMALARASYFAGQVTKYTERHAKKNGRQDLEKALHFAEKWHEVGGDKRVSLQDLRVFLGDAINQYSAEAGLSEMQRSIFITALLNSDDTEKVVRLCKVHIKLEYPVDIPGTPEDGGHHSRG